MALILHSGFSSYGVVKRRHSNLVQSKKDGRDQVPVMKIGLLNLMPDKKKTEEQWFSLLAQSQRWIEPQLIKMQSHHQKGAYDDSMYVNSQSVDLADLSAVIVTGAPIEHLAFEAVDYWQELEAFQTACIQRKIPILGVCWAAQALMYQRFGLEKRQLSEKCFGIFEHDIKTHLFPTLALSTGQLPHSRHTGWHRSEVEAIAEVDLLIDSQEAGPFALRDEVGNWYLTGHVEYELDTLVKEYQRDLNKGIHIQVPKGYRSYSDGSIDTQTHWASDALKLINVWLDDVSQQNENRAIRRWGA